MIKSNNDYIHNEISKQRDTKTGELGADKNRTNTRINQ